MKANLLAAGGITLLALLSGYLLLRPMSDFFVRYLLWRLSAAGTATHGSVRTRDADIHFVCYGNGPAVLLLHGGLSNRLAWFSQIPGLVAAGRRVVLPDIRGHGDSGLGSRELNYRLLASDAIHVLDKLHIRQADVVGWSDGGNTALLLGRYWPQRVGRLVAISANFSPAGLSPEARQDASQPSSGPRYWLSRWWTGAGNRLDELEKRIRRMWRTYPALQPVDLRKIENPTLVLVGKRDLVTLAHANEMAELLPHGRLQVLPGGHFTPISHAREVNAAIATFLDLQSTNGNQKGKF